MRRKSELLRATEQRLFFLKLIELFEGFFAQLIWNQLRKQNRKQAKALAKKGML